MVKKRKSKQVPTLAVAALIFGMLGCSDSEEKSVRFEAHRARTTGGDQLFSPVSSAESGLTVRNGYDDPEMWRGRYQEFQGGAIGTGIAAGDVDGDGWLDLYVVSKTGPNTLYRQTAPLVFVDVTESAGVAGGDGWGTGASLADVDGDGDLDLYVCQINAPNLLYLNDGKGGFSENGATAGLDVVSGSVIGAFEDYDHDGDLDLFLLTNLSDAASSPDGGPDFLFRNNGKGVFTDVTERSGLLSVDEKGHSATWWDANGDGWSDLYIANDFEAPDHLYLNNKDGTFTEKLEETIPHTAWFSMGSDFADVNNDGRLDFLVADMASTTHFKQKVAMGDMGGLIDYMDGLKTPQYMANAFYLNSGKGRFLEAARLLGIAKSDWTWSVRFEDLDNDGWQDLHVTNGMVRSFNDSDLVNQIKRVRSREQVIAMMRRSPPLAETNLAFRNTGDLGFEKRSEDWGLAHEGVSFGSVLADFDNDGDIDIVYSNYNDTVSLYRNNSQSNSITVSLRGTRSNRFGVGASLKLESSAGIQSRQMSLARGALSSNVASIHFGLGEESTAKRLTIRWPSGRIQELNDVASGNHYIISESDSRKAPRERNLKKASTQFADVSEKIGLEFENSELAFNDMIRQPLLPNRMNTLGGGLAIGDADSDGDSDIYFAGAKGQVGALFLNNGKGKFEADNRTNPWGSKENLEEMSPHWVDANGDGALDLYVTSGGVELDAGNSSYQDSLYLNDGHGRFSESTERSLPSMFTSSSAVASADFDRDGDLDVFVGGRVVPGSYPSSPESVLLENDGGRFVAAGLSVAPEIRNLGMVTSALWSDANGDGWLDLIVAGEWEPIRIFLNEEGVLVEKSSPECGLSGYKGWWNSIAAADVDNDGDMDYIAGNVGLNTKYHASLDHPIQLYYGDFEGRGNLNIVEAEFEGDTLFPVRGRSCSTRAMPSLGAKFDSFRKFASAMLTDIYDVEEATQFEANELQHGIFINSGDATFEFRPLPRLTQISPVFGIVAQDMDGDGNVDIVIGQNFHGPQVETGRFDGGQGLFMRGDGTGSMHVVGPTESGVYVPEEARGLAVTDFDSDGRPDLIFTRTGAGPLSLINQSDSNSSMFSVAFGESQALAVGARVSVLYEDGSRRVAELHEGSGYLSQSDSKLYFGYSKLNVPTMIETRWSDGSSTQTKWSRGATEMVLSKD